MAPRKKTLDDYVNEATAENGCLVHTVSHAARICYIMRHGALPEGVNVCHTCDNPACISDAHHFPGTQKANVRDAVGKGRHSSCGRGDKSPRHILTEKEVRHILKVNMPNQVAAKKYGVHHSTISKIKTGKNWSWL